MTELRDYDPLQPRGGLNVKRILERAGALALLIGGTALKWGFVFVKFFGIFISIAAYKLWFGSWTFALGFVLLILVHELGHAVEARRQGLQVSAPTFIPFFGAYVTIRHAGLSPWRNSLISLAGPFAGGLAALACWIVGYRARVDDAHRAREHRLPAQRVQSAADRVPRRRLRLALDLRGVAHAGDPVRGRHPRAGVRARQDARVA